MMSWKESDEAFMPLISPRRNDYTVRYCTIAVFNR
jgi:hypothetical protein